MKLSSMEKAMVKSRPAPLSQVRETGWPTVTAVLPGLTVHSVSSPGSFTPSVLLQPNWA